MKTLYNIGVIVYAVPVVTIGVLGTMAVVVTNSHRLHDCFYKVMSVFPEPSFK